MQANRSFSSRSVAVMCGLLMTAAAIRAQTPAAPAAPTNALPSFEVKTVAEEAGGLGTFYRAFITIGTNKAVFLVPKGYQLRSQPQQWAMTLTGPEGLDVITIRCYGPQPAAHGQAAGARAELSAEACEGILHKRHPKATVLERFTATAADQSGPAFELSVGNAVGEPQLARAVFIPALASAVEFELIGSAKSFDNSRAALNSVLVTFRAAAGGKLEYAPISDKL